MQKIIRETVVVEQRKLLSHPAQSNFLCGAGSLLLSVFTTFLKLRYIKKNTKQKTNKQNKTGVCQNYLYNEARNRKQWDYSKYT